jgi:hypothetical protein
LAHTKEEYDEHVRNSPARELVNEPVADSQFVFAVQRCGGELAKWRAAHNVSAPLKFVFDLTPDKDRKEITTAFFGAASNKSQYQDGIEQWFAPVGVSYESRKAVVQLLSADMLAWTAAAIRSREVFMRGEFAEAYQTGHLFTGTPHIRIGYTSKETLEKWENDVLSSKAGGAPLLGE